MAHIKKSMSAAFDAKLFGKLTAFVGWSITSREDGIKIDQRGYVNQILEDHGINEVNGCIPPLPRAADVLPARENETVLDDQDQKNYSIIIGSLLYLAVCTRLDVLLSVAVIARKAHSRTSEHI